MLETSFGSNYICGTQQSGNAGERIVGGPNWPTTQSTDKESGKACADECNNQPGCTHYIWFSDKGCRTQTSCSEAVAGYGHVTSFICAKGKTMFPITYFSIIKRSFKII